MQGVDGLVLEALGGLRALSRREHPRVLVLRDQHAKHREERRQYQLLLNNTHTRVSGLHCTHSSTRRKKWSCGKCLDFGVRAHAKSFDKGAKSEGIGCEANQAGPVLEECSHGVQAHHPARPALFLCRLFLLGVLGSVPGLGRKDLRVRVRNRRQQALQSTNEYEIEVYRDS